MEKKIILRNICSSFLLQIVTMISGFVIPKAILSHFGSEVNGLISSMNQFLNYIQLLEGGLSGVVMSALYKPLAEQNKDKISAVINATRGFFRHIAIIFFVYMIGIAVGYPLLVNTGFTFEYSFALVVVLGSNLFVQYFFSLTFRILLSADRKVYIVSAVQIVIVIINLIVVVVLTECSEDILIIKLAGAVIFLIQPIVFGWYVKKHYSIDKSIPPDNEALSQRWSGFGINLAYFVHTNTDVVILTIFSTLANVSVYSIYLLVVNALKNFVISISQAIMPSFGKVLVSGDRYEINQKFELYEFGLYFIATLAFSCGLFLITPFVKIYTANIHDADYEQYVFGYILVLAEMVYCYRDSYVTAAYSAGHFRQVSRYAIIEVVINLSLSLLLVSKMGITGVAIGTLVSMIYRGIAHVWYIKKNILYRNPQIAFKKMVIFSTCILLSFILSTFLVNITVNSMLDWIIEAFFVFAINLVIITIVSFIFFREDFNVLVVQTINKIRRKQ